jgi:hypothetical protein
MKDKIINKIGFPLLLGLGAMSLSFTAAAFSIYGLANLFSAAFISVIIMATSLELGKFLGVIFLYRYWDKAKTFLKVYLLTAVLVLMFITSAGIYGFLTSAYQQSSIQFKLEQDKISLLELKKPMYQDRVIDSQKRISTLNKVRESQESRLNEAMTNSVLARNPIQLKQIQQQTIDLINQSDKDIRDENLKIQTAMDDKQKVDDEIGNLKINASTKKDIQTFKFVADALGVSLDKVTNWMVLTLIFVFDPLAIFLILAYNVVVYKKEDTVADPKKLLLDSEPPSSKKIINDVVSEDDTSKKFKSPWWKRFLPAK